MSHLQDLPASRLAGLGHRLDSGVRRLGSRRAGLFTLACALLLAAPSIGPHRALDDYVLGLIASGHGAAVGLPRGELDLFTFTRGDPDGNTRLMDVGLMLPWWTDPHLKIAFFRPLSSLTHWLDERLWPASPAAMHAHSLAWFAALLFAALSLYRRIEGEAWLAGFAFLLYALDDAHAPALAWLSNRNALVAATFACLSISAHVAWRREGNRFAGVLGGFALLAGLLAGELAVGALSYLVAYAVFLDRGTPRARALSVAPYVGIVALWRAAWVHGGYGAHGSGAYVDPLGDPLGFLVVAPAKIAMLLHGQLSVPPSDLAFLAPPKDGPLLLAIAVLTVAVATFLFWRLAREDRTARFWTLGTLMSVLPLAATFPSDRLLLLVGLGAMPLLARLFAGFAVALTRADAQGEVRHWLTAGFVAIHLVAAPILLPLRAAQMELFGFAHDRGAAGVPNDPAVREETVVVVAAPTVLFANYIQAQRELEGVVRPRHLYVLAGASSALEVERTGPQALAIRPREGFLYTQLERHYRGDVRMARGDRIELSTMTAEVRAVGEEGRPMDVEFVFGEPEGEYRFLTWRNGRFEPFVLPEVGQPVTLPEEDFGKVLVGAVLGGG